MKKPDDIKKLLANHKSCTFSAESLFADALAYIQQLEEHIAFLNEILQEEVYRKDAAIADINMVCPCEVCTRSCKYDKVNAYSECADFEWRGVPVEG